MTSKDKERTDKKREDLREKAQKLLNKQKFEQEWKVLLRGEATTNYQLAIIAESLAKVMTKPKDLMLASKQLSKLLGADLGMESWNVIMVIGPFSRRTVASGGHYVVFERFDKMQAILWLNKLTPNFKIDKSIVKQSQYF